MNATENAKAGTARPRQRKALTTPTPAPQERDAMIAVAAYYRAEKRGFGPGAELEDWLDAEAEIVRLLSADKPDCPGQR